MQRCGPADLFAMLRRPHEAALVVCVLGALTGCAGSTALPDLAAPPPAASTQPAPGVATSPNIPLKNLGSGPAPVESQVAAPIPGAQQGHIIGIRSHTIMLYSSATGGDGQKVPKSMLALPLPVVARSSSGLRLAVQTTEGVRWVAAADVFQTEGGVTAPSTARAQR